MCFKRLASQQKMVKGTVLRVGFFFEGLNILINTFCVSADGFQDLSKAFQCPIQSLTFYFLWNYLLILKMLTETLLKTSFSVIGWCSQVPTSHWLQGKCAIINVSQVAIGMAASCKHFQCQNCRFRVFEAGYWKDFWNK